MWSVPAATGSSASLKDVLSVSAASEPSPACPRRSRQRPNFLISGRERRYVGQWQEDTDPGYTAREMRSEVDESDQEVLMAHRRDEQCWKTAVPDDWQELWPGRGQMIPTGMSACKERPKPLLSFWSQPAAHMSSRNEQERA